MGAVTAQRPQGQGLFAHPGLLAAVAAALASTVAALWAMRGLPFGTGLFWLASFPLFAAGLGFGAIWPSPPPCWRRRWSPSSATASPPSLI